ncbi:exodeoxyribonuclease VII large subunit [Bacterioplanes sanyensis]|uniref:Exodeoxyribonuclease 7 large subunit n=1 Tax=Bacterioplanes sanyensis TaxID=1249553 RepID=A0A222FMH0_9GAMM|nr:exodeoxyribonuclease VII large subunit [Bacterioplanes sanyensis]ASP39970.1 exodeoxyribonuclease VII large subunit [Bacterioplanes sanyensis]
MSQRPHEQPVFSVSQLNDRARQLLEISFAQVRVKGEISNLSRPSSGHWYFTLKDEQSQVRCAMFRSRTAQLAFDPKAGDRVELRAKVSLYAARGDYQLIVDSMKPAGEGALLLAFEQLKRKLLAEGLLDASLKRPIPAPRRVAIITSPSGAAIHDMLTVFQRRDPSIEIDVYPSMVQGKAATANLVAALQRANRDQRADVIIIGRGGGSLEDLWCFNDESLARAIAASQLPVVSAVGHEVDTSIADLVADLRAPTPSAAAELLSSDRSQQRQRLVELAKRLWHSQQRQLKMAANTVQQLRGRLRSPQQLLQDSSQRLDQLELRLGRAWQQQQQHRHERLASRLAALQHCHPERAIEQQQQNINSLQQRLQRAMHLHLQHHQDALAHQVQMLNNLSPLQVLTRGYAIAQSADGSVIRNASEVALGERITTRVQQGTLHCQVIGTDTESAS